MANIQLRQLTLETTPAQPGAPGASAPSQQLSGVLVIKGSITALVPVEDTIELLVALLSNLPYTTAGRELAAHWRRGQVELTASSNGSLRVLVTLSHEQYYVQVRDMVTQVATKLSSLGAGQLAGPLLAVLGSPPESNGHARGTPE